MGRLRNLPQARALCHCVTFGYAMSSLFTSKEQHSKLLKPTKATAHNPGDDARGLFVLTLNTEQTTGLPEAVQALRALP